MSDRRKTFVYFLTSDPIARRKAEIIRVKIGLAYDPNRRIKQLQTGNPDRLRHYRAPVPFWSRSEAFRFEAWAKNYARRRGNELPGGTEFFEIEKKVVDYIVKRYESDSGRKAPLVYGEAARVLFVIRILFNLVFLPLVVLKRTGDIVGAYCRRKFGISPAGYILTHLFLFFYVTKLNAAILWRSVCRLSVKVIFRKYRDRSFLLRRPAFFYPNRRNKSKPQLVTR